MIPKRARVDSPKLRKAAEGKGCTLRIPGVCRGGEAVLCHLPSSIKGTGNKSPDIFSVVACFHCHNWLDRRGNSWRKDPPHIDRYQEILRALFETWEIFANHNLIKVAE